MSVYLPVEVILEILKRLPVKLVVKCMSVCKTWYTLIKTPSFISTHLQTSLSKPQGHHFLLLHRSLPNDKNAFSLHFDNDKFDELKQLSSPVNGGVRVVGSCNGLVCLSCDKDSLNLILWNPSIQKCITLPKPSITKNHYFVFGFGFDSRTNDYKLLARPNEPVETPSEAYLFSLNENSWKRVAAIPPKHYISLRISSTFVNGAFHWVGFQKQQDDSFVGMILGFDISTEQFFVLMLPESWIPLPSLDLSIWKYEESSIAVHWRDWEYDYANEIELWVMRKYGVVGSWTQVLHFPDQSGRIPEVLGFRKNGEVLLEVYRGEMVSLDLNSRQMKNLIKAEEGISFVDSYVESLALLDRGVDACSMNYAIPYSK